MAINPANGEMVIIEMNPRVSRSSALASKATGAPTCLHALVTATGGAAVCLVLQGGRAAARSYRASAAGRPTAASAPRAGFPIAKMAAKLACGYTLDQIPNDITLKTPASFEPSIDYVVTKVPAARAYCCKAAAGLTARRCSAGLPTPHGGPALGSVPPISDPCATPRFACRSRALRLRSSRGRRPR